MALSADTAFIGSYRDGGGGEDSGTVYVFERTATSWVERQQLSASDGAKGDFFGTSTALSQNTALIGAHGDDDVAVSSGPAYVFVRADQGWQEQIKLTAREPSEFSQYGAKVALDGDTGLIGAYGDRRVEGAAGAAYVVALLLVEGQSCAVAAECASTFCVDGVCCGSACSGPCESCDVPEVAGICALAAPGEVPSSSCGGLLCDGIVGTCPGACSGDVDCRSDYDCQAATTCVPKADDGEACARGNGCVSGYCIDGVCCDQACDASCGSCATVGHEGTCTALSVGCPGAPSCAPYLCTGAELSCPESCSGHSECDVASYCAEGSCQPHIAQGDGCAEDESCASSHCTDGVCCVAGSCGAYRCGPIGACEKACSSSAQCADGHACNSDGTFEPGPGASASAESGGACHVAETSMPAPGSLGQVCWGRWTATRLSLAHTGTTMRVLIRGRSTSSCVPRMVRVSSRR